MNKPKEILFNIIDSIGYTQLSIHYPAVKKQFVLEHLEQSNNTDEFKQHHRNFINLTFFNKGDSPNIN